MSFSLLQLSLLCGTAALSAAVLGFVAGWQYGRAEPARTLARARRHLSGLVDALLETMQQAESLSAALGRFPNGRLSTDQTEKIDRRRSRLFSVLADAVKSLTPAPVTEDDETTSTGPTAKPSPKPEPFAVEWVREPVCDRTELPTRGAFETNLANLFDSANRAPTSFGVMLVEIDKLDGLKQRFGPAAADTFVRTTGRMLLHGVRDQDLVCRYTQDTFAVLIPDVGPEAAEQVACTVRDTIRQHRFHVEPTGPEVLVTTSLGLALCHPGENLPLLLGRVGDALRRSRKRGRNQLHLHDGQSVNRCVSA